MNPNPGTSIHDQLTVPRTIWTLWLQGWDEAPPIVRACVASWARENPTWALRALTGRDLCEWGDCIPARPPRMTTTSYSDLVRTGLLAAHGGVWVDATLYCVRPLDSWLPAVAATGFFAFRLKSQRPLATWLIAAEPAHPLIDAWAAQARSYWIDRDRFDTYFWLHQQFAQCCLNSPALARAWGDVPEVPAGHAHAFWPAERTLMRPMPAELRRRIDMRLDPVYKLSHRVPSRFPPGSAGEFFLRFVPARAPSPAKN